MSPARLAKQDTPLYWLMSCKLRLMFNNSNVLLERALLFLFSKCMELLRHKPALTNHLFSKFFGLLLQNIPNTYSDHCGPDISGKQQMEKIAQIRAHALHSTTVPGVQYPDYDKSTKIWFWIIIILNLFSVLILGKTQPIHQFASKFLPHCYTSSVTIHSL